MAKRPSLRESLRASLSKGLDVETAELMARDNANRSPSSPDMPDGLILDSQIQDPQIVNGQTEDPHTVAYHTVQPLTVIRSTILRPDSQPLDSPPSDRSPSTGGPSDRSPSDGPLSDGHLVDGPIVEHETLSAQKPPNVPNGLTVDPHPSDGLILDQMRDPQKGQLSDGSTSDRPLSRYETISCEIRNLSYNQAAILEHLIRTEETTGGMTSVRTIAEDTKIGIPSTRDAISRLVRRGFIADPVTIRTANFQGFSYVLNKRLATQFMESGGLEQINHRSIRPSIIPRSNGQLSNRGLSNNQTVSLSDRVSANGLTANGETVDSVTPFSSSNVIKLPTTTQPETVRPFTMAPSDNNQDKFIISGPVGMYWEEVGLLEGQAQTWCKQFDADPQQMKQQLEWARYDLINNGKINEVKKDPVSWFFGCLRQTGGCYPRPANYKSLTQLRAEAMEEELAKEKEAKERLRIAELEKRFQLIMDNPDGAEYRALFDKTDSFAQGTKGIMLTQTLKNVFFEENK